MRGLWWKLGRHHAVVVRACVRLGVGCLLLAQRAPSLPYRWCYRRLTVDISHTVLESIFEWRMCVDRWVWNTRWPNDEWMPAPLNEAKLSPSGTPTHGQTQSFLDRHAAVENVQRAYDRPCSSCQHSTDMPLRNDYNMTGTDHDKHREACSSAARLRLTEDSAVRSGANLRK